MQVCLNGHVITDRYYGSDLSRKKFCTSCGESTIINCQHCKAPIPGHITYENITVFLPFPVSAPKICAECGGKFPWFEQQTVRENNEREALSKKKEQEEHERKLKGMGKIHVSVGGQGNVVSLGSIHDSVIANTNKLTKAGDGNVAHAIQELTEAIKNSNELSADVKQEHLEQLNTLSLEALKPKDQRLPVTVLKPLINFGLGALSGASDLATVWETWSEPIKHFFLT